MMHPADPPRPPATSWTRRRRAGFVVLIAAAVVGQMVIVTYVFQALLTLAVWAWLLLWLVAGA